MSLVAQIVGHHVAHPQVVPTRASFNPRTNPERVPVPNAAESIGSDTSVSVPEGPKVALPAWFSGPTPASGGTGFSTLLDSDTNGWATPCQDARQNACSNLSRRYRSPASGSLHTEVSHEGILRGIKRESPKPSRIGAQGSKSPPLFIPPKRHPGREDLWDPR